MNLAERCENMMRELGIPVTNFCRNIGIVVASYYAWRKGKFNFSEKTTQRIDEYLKKYGF